MVDRKSLDGGWVCGGRPGFGVDPGVRDVEGWGLGRGEGRGRFAGATEPAFEERRLFLVNPTNPFTT